MAERKFYPMVTVEGGPVQGIRVNAWLEFFGAEAEIAESNALAEDHHFEPRSEERKSATGDVLGATYRAYLPLSPVTINGATSFSDFSINQKMTMLKLDLGAIKIQFMREDGYRAVCVRESEIETLRAEGKSPFWGFGRPHPFLPGFPVHQKFAGPIVVPQGSDVFEPVFIKVHQNETGEEKIFLVNATVSPGSVHVAVVVATQDAVPQELVSYEFGSRRCGSSCTADQDSFEASASIQRFIKKK